MVVASMAFQRKINLQYSSKRNQIASIIKAMDMLLEQSIVREIYYDFEQDSLQRQFQEGSNIR